MTIFAPELEEFYNSHNIDLSSLDNNNATIFPYRFIRLNPRYDIKETLKLLEKEILELEAEKSAEEDNNNQVQRQQIPTSSTGGCPPINIKEVSWVGRQWKFYAIPSTFPLQTSKSFSSGRIYGMDVSSGAAISTLFASSDSSSSSSSIDSIQKQQQKQQKEIMESDDDTINTKNNTNNNNNNNVVRILDLCCCPGLKLCAMADYFWEEEQTKQRNNNSTTTTTIVGVDISETRMAICKKIIQKYHINKETCGGDISSRSNNDNNNTTINIQLFCQDGTTFGTTMDNATTKDQDNLVFDTRAAIEEMISREDCARCHRGSTTTTTTTKRKRMNKSARAREKKRLKQYASENWQVQQTQDYNEKEEECNSNNNNIQQQQQQRQIMKSFDYVLVDAECSTDGSLKHLRERLLKKNKRGSTTTATIMTPQVPVDSDNNEEADNNNNCINEDQQADVESNTILTDKQKLADLVDLQRRLLYSGYRLLKRGSGRLVYSTCSLSKEQNEDVVNWLLSQHKDAYLIPVEFPETTTGKNNKLVVSGSIPGTLRFYPNLIGQEKEKQQQPGDHSYSSLSPSLGGLYGDGFFVAKIGKRCKEEEK